MKNKNTLISLLFATGSIVAMVIILGNLESPSSSQTTSYKEVSPSNTQTKGVSPGISYEYDYNDDDKDHNDDYTDKRNEKHSNKGKNQHRNGVNDTAPTVPTAPDLQIPRQSNTQAS